MSTTTDDIKRPWEQAKREAHAFLNLFPASCYLDWKVAGSLRRRRDFVGDIDHVVIPKFREGFPADLLGGVTTINETWEQLERLINSRTVVRDHAKPCWGEKHRRVLFSFGAGVFDHEIYMADERNFGSVLAIRTGPPEYSMYLVTQLQRQGLRNYGGYVRRQDTGDVVPAPTEEEFFRLAGVPFVAPERRG